MYYFTIKMNGKNLVKRKRNRNAHYTITDVDSEFIFYTKTSTAKKGKVTTITKKVKYGNE